MSYFENKKPTKATNLADISSEKPISDSDEDYISRDIYVTRMLSYAASPPKLPSETRETFRTFMMSRPALPSFEATRMMTSPSRPIESRPKTGLTYASFPVKFTFMKGTEWYPISNTRGWYCDKCHKYPSSGRRFACGDPTKDLDLCEDCVITIAPEETIDAITEEMESLKRMFVKAQDVITRRHAKKDAELVETMSSLFITGTEAVKPDSIEWLKTCSPPDNLMVAAQEEDRLRRSKSYIKVCKFYTDNLISPPASLDKEVQMKAAKKANLSLEQYRALSSEYIENDTFRKVAFWIDVSHKMMRYEHGDLTNQRISIPTTKIYNLDGTTTTYKDATNHLPTTTPYKVKFGSSTWPPFLPIFRPDYPTTFDLVIFTSEAHTDDVWPLGFTNSKRPTTIEERLSDVNEFLKSHPLPETTKVLVDNMDNDLAESFYAWPHRTLHIVDHNLVTYDKRPEDAKFSLMEWKQYSSCFWEICEWRNFSKVNNLIEKLTDKTKTQYNLQLLLQL